MDNRPDVWVVYEKPSDYPDDFVVRRQSATAGKVVADRDPWAVVGSLEAARGLLPPGLVRLDRHPSDDPNIVETWI
jgi:hypothetical protein